MPSRIFTHRSRWAIAVAVCIFVFMPFFFFELFGNFEPAKPKRYTIADQQGGISMEVSYFFDPTPRIYDESVEYCQSKGGVIASIHSAEQQAYVERVAQGIAYLGARSDGHGAWSWEDGTNWDYVHPVNDGLKGVNETALVIRMDKHGKWNDWATGGSAFGVVCRSAEAQLQVPRVMQTIQLICQRRPWLQAAPLEGTVELLGTSSLKTLPSKRVLVTGGAGFIGSHATLRLLEEGYAVLIVDNLSRGHLVTVRKLQELACELNGTLVFAVADLAHGELLDMLLQAFLPEVVLHFAAVAFVGESMANPLLYFRNITENTITLLSAMERANVAKIVYSSSCTTYGEHGPSEMPITENTTQNPMNVYGRAKVMAEQVIFNWVTRRPSVCATVLRYFNVIGADPRCRLGEVPRIRGDSLDTRISGALFDACSGRIKKFRVLGDDFPTKDGTAERDYIHVSDLVDAHLLMLNRSQPAKVGALATCKPEVFNVGLGVPNSVMEFLRVGKDLKGALPFEVEILPRRPGDPASVYARPYKLMALGWKPRFTDLRQSLEHEWNFRMAHPELFPGQRTLGGESFRK